MFFWPFVILVAFTSFLCSSFVRMACFFGSISIMFQLFSRCNPTSKAYISVSYFFKIAFLHFMKLLDVDTYFFDARISSIWSNIGAYVFLAYV